MTQYMAMMFKDDITGEDGDYSVTFGLDKDWYRIELTEANRNKMREIFEGYAKVATKVSFGLDEVPARSPVDVIRKQQEDERVIEWLLTTNRRKRRPTHVTPAMRRLYQNREDRDI